MQSKERVWKSGISSGGNLAEPPAGPSAAAGAATCSLHCPVPPPTPPHASYTIWGGHGGTPASGESLWPTRNTWLSPVPKKGVSPEKRSISCMCRRSPGQSSLSPSQPEARRAESQVANGVLGATSAGLNAAVVAQRLSHHSAPHQSGLKMGEVANLAGHRSCVRTRQRVGSKRKEEKTLEVGVTLGSNFGCSSAFEQGV